MNLKADTITEILILSDHKAITELIIIIIVQTKEILATAITETTVIIAHIIIIKATTCHKVIHDHRSIEITF